ncbi:hypothetical protein CON45_23925 [Priestia megaterium]|uniref:hypothetical protein n=1 Tax=Priestia megaterium TaxID=1404 RepID=UPI000BEE1598|nr:hypothetical protein [Priestia megaterium]PEA36577.1 hypothetical protein CON45_23925 [Priestia megaterium]
MWAINIYSSLTLGLSTNISEHFNVFREFNQSEHEDFFFSSYHLDDIPKEEPLRASYRAKALLQMFNGILLLSGDLILDYDLHNIFFLEKGKKDSYEWSRHTIYKTNRDLEYEELQNPFQPRPEHLYTYKNVPKNDKNRKNYLVDFFDYAYKDEFVKEVLTLFILSKKDILFILINTTKIVETIEYDLGITNATSAEEKSKLLSEEFQQAYKFFKDKKSKFSHFSNSEYGSGIFARHGVSDQKKYHDKEGNLLPAISFEEIDKKTRTLIYEWINYKLENDKGYRYPPVIIENLDEPMKDEDYNFDL